MSTRAADDFDTIKARLEELRKQENIRSTPESTQEPVTTAENTPNIPQQGVDPKGVGSEQLDDLMPTYMADYYKAATPLNADQRKALEIAQRKIQEFYKQAQVIAKEMSIGYSNKNYFPPHNLDVKD